MSLLLGACRMKSGLGCGQPTSLSFGACRLQGWRGLQPRRHARAYASTAILMCVDSQLLGSRQGAADGSRVRSERRIRARYVKRRDGMHVSSESCACTRKNKSVHRWDDDGPRLAAGEQGRTFHDRISHAIASSEPHESKIAQWSSCRCAPRSIGADAPRTAAPRSANAATRAAAAGVFKGATHSWRRRHCQPLSRSVPDRAELADAAVCDSVLCCCGVRLRRRRLLLWRRWRGANGDPFGGGVRRHEHGILRRRRRHVGRAVVGCPGPRLAVLLWRHGASRRCPQVADQRAPSHEHHWRTRRLPCRDWHGGRPWPLGPDATRP